MRRLLVVLLALAPLVARAASAATARELAERAAELAAQLDAIRADHGRLLERAAALADAVTRRKQAATAARADRELTRRLRELDELAMLLDERVREAVGVERRLARAVSEFERAADREERRLREQLPSARPSEPAAEELAALFAARRRVAAIRPGSGGFRPPLEVTIQPLDGPDELEAKIAIIDAERERVATRAGELEREQSILAARLEAGREWARGLGAARREAAGRVELLDEMHEEADTAERRLSEREQAIARERSSLRVADEALAARRREAEERLRSLEGRQGGR